MESAPGDSTLLLTARCNQVYVVILLTLCATPLFALSTDISLTASPSFSTTSDPGTTFSTTSHSPDLDTSTQNVNLTQVLPSSSGHLSEATTGTTSNLSESLETSLATSSLELGSSHVNPAVTQTETLSGVTSTSMLLEPTLTPLSSSVVASTTIPGASYTDTEGMNSTVSTPRTTVPGNDNITKSTVDSAGSMATSTVPPFGNGSCSGNNTGCPEYNGKQDLALPTSAIIGIAVGAAVLVIIIVCLLLCLCRRRRTLSGSKADLSTYWDDNVTLSYINGHLDYPKDISDEMVSLDNDSFLNSLDSMSFSNMWATENAKHTNF